MAQYSNGTVTVTNGSPIVTGLSTLWLTNASAGDIFTITDGVTNYTIGSVGGDATFTLTSPYAELSASGLGYSISRDFTPNLNLVYWPAGAINTAQLNKANMLILDNSVISGSSATLSSLNLSGDLDIGGRVIGDVNIDGDLNVEGGQIGTAVSTFIDFNIQGLNHLRLQSGALRPLITNSFDLGTGGIRYRDGFFSGNIQLDSTSELRGSNSTNSTANIVRVGGVTQVYGDTGTTDHALSASATVFRPSASGTDIGNSSFPFRDLILSGDAGVDGILGHGVQTTINVTGNSITGTKSYHRINTSAAPQTINTINGYSEGDRLILRTSSPLNSFTLGNGIGNIFYPGPSIVLSLTSSTVELLCVDGGNSYLVINRN